jgi:hypothetical protein
MENVQQKLTQAGSLAGERSFLQIQHALEGVSDFTPPN